MDAKEFLSQATVLNEKINMDFLHLQKLRELLERLGGSASAQRERVQGGALPNAPATKIVDQIADLEVTIDRELAEYDLVLKQIKDAIAFCGEWNEIRILKNRYLEEQKWTTISQEVGLSERRVLEIHNSGLLKVEQYLKSSVFRSKPQ